MMLVLRALDAARAHMGGGSGRVLLVARPCV